MCGIAGEFTKIGVSDPILLLRMISSLDHRGPDAKAVYVAGAVGLAHARLSIVDVAGGAQPMSNEDGTIWITFNGEIFNHVELRAELEGRGHRFATRCDTEVIVHLYEDKGEDCVHELNGQWAFAIWDARKRSLFLSRDRLGVRPLFYTRADGSFLFASEIKALLEHAGVERALDAEALNEIFTYWVTLPPRTAFRGISELPPGHSMTVSERGERCWRYWELDYGVEDPREEDELSEDLLTRLSGATRLRLRADVPVGAYLSGGLDSTLIAALIRKVSSAPVKTFSIGFDEAEFDESAYQDDAALFLRTDHEHVRCSARDIQEVFPEVVRHAEKPILRTAPAPMYLLSKLVRTTGLKVVLTGEGADEMFGGYDIFKEAKVRRFWAAQPESRLRPLLLRKLYPYLGNVQAQPDAYLRAFFHITDDGPFFSHCPRWELTSRLRTFLTPEYRAEAAKPALPARFDNWDAFSQAQYLETEYLLPGYILSSQGDRMAMAHSVEGRFPFLDRDVVAFASRLPTRMKMKVLNEKYLLKRAAAGLIPETVRTRSKQPYRAPEANCFFGAGPADYVDELLSPERIRRDGVFDARPVQQLVKKFRNGTAIGVKDNMALTGILSTQLLINQFL